MKYASLLLLIIIASCNTPPNNNTSHVNIDSLAQARMNQIQAVKDLLDRSTQYIKLQIDGKLSLKKAQQLNNAVMDSFYAAYKNLGPDDTLDVYNYRLQKINELIDEKVKRNTR